jgi:uncharacterized protein YjiS (DUF1127 family)
MEGAMPKHDLESLQPLVLDHRQLTPADYSRMRQLVTVRAKMLRTEFLRELWRQITSWHQRRTALAQLAALDDTALKDIGLHRSGIEAAVVKAATRPAPQKKRAFPEKPHLCLQRTG